MRNIAKITEKSPKFNVLDSYKVKGQFERASKMKGFNFSEGMNTKKLKRLLY